MARISNSPTVVSNVLAGAALAGALSPDARDRAAGAWRWSLFYTAGMLLNDVCDYGWDLPSDPSGRWSPAQSPRQAALVGSRRAVRARAARCCGWSGSGRIRWRPGADRADRAVRRLAQDQSDQPAGHGRLPADGLRHARSSPFAWPPTSSLAIAGGPAGLYMVGLTAHGQERGAAGRGSATGQPCCCCCRPLYFVVAAPSLWRSPHAVPGSPTSVRFVYRPTERQHRRAIARLIAGISLLDALVLAASGAAPAAGRWSRWSAGFSLTLLLQRYMEGT